MLKLFLKLIILSVLLIALFAQCSDPKQIEHITDPVELPPTTKEGLGTLGMLVTAGNVDGQVWLPSESPMVIFDTIFTGTTYNEEVIISARKAECSN